jgi:hypothetical protein
VHEVRVTSYHQPTEFETLDVACPVCGAAIGATCVKPGHQPKDWREVFEAGHDRDQGADGAVAWGSHTKRGYWRTDVYRLGELTHQREERARRRALLEQEGMTEDLESAMTLVAWAAMRNRKPELWIERVCEETPPAGLDDAAVLADWYEVLGFRAMRPTANEEYAP